ncbi:hypothetical protein [Corynebacterium heidelbergense]|uniref:DUF5666 domain-containing protein n=1 Tax=Corynebacterium heidelbergense TaxID=2055947 RepID=A0A364VEA5_9CORY|nr:hypothetical protein [Corynebacterium heidelbergense]RAV34979.1 hypothetical protein CWC39_00540 [Corynebacterium heidelbergense]
MEDRTVKPLKPSAARGALTLIAAGSALALAGCGAGQISQTNTQVAAVNGSAGSVKNVTVRDVTVLVGPDGTGGVKFNAGNNDESGEKVTLKSVTVRNQPVTLEGDTTIQPNCNLVADIAPAIQQLDEDKNTSPKCPTYVITGLTMKNLYPGGHEEVKLEFDKGSVTVNAAVAAPTPEAGQYYRGPNGSVTDEKNFMEEHKQLAEEK